MATQSESTDVFASLMQLYSLLSSSSNNQLTQFIKNIIYDKQFDDISIKKILFNALYESYKENQLSTTTINNLINKFPLQKTSKQHKIRKEPKEKKIICPKHILEIPTDSIKYIFSFFDLQNLFEIEEVCKDFLYISRDIKINHLTVSSWDLRRPKYVLSTRKWNVAQKYLDRFSNIISLHIEYDDFVWHQNWLHTLKHLTINYTKRRPGTKRGQFLSESRFHCKRFDESCGFFSTLRNKYHFIKLTIETFEAPYNMTRSIIWNDKLHCPSLKKLVLHNCQLFHIPLIRLLRKTVNLIELILNNTSLCLPDGPWHVKHTLLAATKEQSLQSLKYIRINIDDGIDISDSSVELYYILVDWVTNTNDIKDKEVYLSLLPTDCLLMEHEVYYFGNISNLTVDVCLNEDEYIDPLKLIENSLIFYQHQFENLTIIHDSMSHGGEWEECVRNIKKYQKNVTIVNK